MTIPLSGCWAEMTLGNPRANCSRFGICGARLLSDQEARRFLPRTAAHVQVWLSVPVPGRVRCFFPGLGMLATTRAIFFEAGVFRIEAPAELPAELTQRLGVPAATIAPGNYHCREVENGYRVDLPVVHAPCVVFN
jgi:hypothetical protein